MNMRNQGQYRGAGGGRGPGPDQQVVNSAIERVPQLLDKEKDASGSVLIEVAEELGRHLVNNRMTTAQIRKLYAEVKRLDFSSEGAYKANMVRAKLAYTAGRHREVADLQKVLDRALKEVVNHPDKHQRFVDFFEAIVAFHKKHGGQE